MYLTSPISSYIYFGEDTRATHCNSTIYIGSVPTEELDSFDERLRKSFQRIVDSGIDMQRMTMVINRDERQLLSKLESSKGDTFSDSIIGDLLYGAEDGSNLPASMDDIAHYKALRAWSAKDWAKLLHKYVHCSFPFRALKRYNLGIISNNHLSLSSANLRLNSRRSWRKTRRNDWMPRPRPLVPGV